MRSRAFCPGGYVTAAGTGIGYEAGLPALVTKYTQQAKGVYGYTRT